MSQLKIYLPPPKNWQDFQDLIREIAEVRYDPATVIEYARQGQRQNGVDVYAEDTAGLRIGIQCKETKNSLTVPEVEEEIAKAKKFRPALHLFIVATTDRINPRIQAAVIKTNQKKILPFKVRVEFWDDLVGDINRFALVLNRCYQQYSSAFAKDDESQHLSCMRTAFDRPAFKDKFEHERSLTEFEEAFAATKRLFRTGLLVDRWSDATIVQAPPVDSLPVGTYRTQIMRVEKKLEQIYREFIADRTKLTKDPTYLGDRAGHYNIRRRELLNALNAILKNYEMDPIDAP